MADGVNCLACSAPIVRTGKRGRPKHYCNATCQNRARYHRNVLFPNRHCEHCGRPITEGRRRRYCNQTCRWRYNAWFQCRGTMAPVGVPGASGDRLSVPSDVDGRGEDEKGRR